MENPTYIGDGVYAYFDGNGIELRLGRHDSDFAVYLEPEVTENLIDFFQANRKIKNAVLGFGPCPLYCSRQPTAEIQ